MKDVDKARFLDAPISQGGLFGGHRRGLRQAVLGGTAAVRGDPAHPAPAWCTIHSCPRGQASVCPSPWAPSCILQSCSAPGRIDTYASASSLSQESGAPRVPARPQVVQEVDEAALTRAISRKRKSKLQHLRRRREQRRSFPRWRAGRRIFYFVLFLFRCWSKGQSGKPLSCARRLLSSWQRMQSSRSPPAEMRQGIYSPYFIVPKKGGGLRPILDLRVLNRALHKLPFKMLTHRRIQPQDWFAAIDLKDAYFHVSILPRHRPFLRFAFEGRAWQYRVLPFGLSLSPRVFTKVVEGALTPLREVTQVCVSPSEPTRTDIVQAQGGRGAGPAGCAPLAHPDLVSRTHFPRDSTSLAHSSEEEPPFSGARHHMAPRVQIYGTSMCGSWTGRGRLECSTTGGGRDHHSG